jgi:hypothetical protein
MQTTAQGRCCVCRRAACWPAPRMRRRRTASARRLRAGRRVEAGAQQHGAALAAAGGPQQAVKLCGTWLCKCERMPARRRTEGAARRTR